MENYSEQSRQNGTAVERNNCVRTFKTHETHTKKHGSKN